MAVALGRLTPFTSIGKEERANLFKALKKPLSGYLGGIKNAGYWITRLQHEWANEFEVEHAVACNSATSGLLAACLACGISAGDEVWVTSYSMSATAACAAVLGAKLRFLDIEAYTFGVDMFTIPLGMKPKALIVTHLFGCPMRDIIPLAEYCRKSGIYLIEDCAQSPFAAPKGHAYVGSYGDIGVFSLNVHKVIQAGEGGVVVTNNHELALKCWDAINHGELAGARPGLNLRMTETTAAIACAQLRKVHMLINRKIELGATLSDAVNDGPRIVRPPLVGGQHVFYAWAGLCGSYGDANRIVAPLAKAGLPIRVGYSKNLADVFGCKDEVSIARDIDKRLIVFDCCQLQFTSRQLIKLGRMMREAVEEAQDGGRY